MDIQKNEEKFILWERITDTLEDHHVYDDKVGEYFDGFIKAGNLTEKQLLHLEFFIDSLLREKDKQVRMEYDE